MTNTTPIIKTRPERGWRVDHLAWDRIDRSYKGRWEYEPDCGCAKCENFWNDLAACVGDFPEEGC
jgi:hypothetical protein